MNMVELLQALNTLEETKDTCHVCHEDPCSCPTEEGFEDHVNKDVKMKRMGAKPLSIADKLKIMPSQMKAMAKGDSEDDLVNYNKTKQGEVGEGAEFGAYYSEQLAQKVFDEYPDLKNEKDILRAGFMIATKDLGAKGARHQFWGDEDFPGDFVSAFSYLKKQKQHGDESQGAQGDVGGAHGEETISPIHGGQKEQPTMENLDVASLKYLAGVNQTIAECGMGGPLGNPSSPASINITAGSGSEVSSMLKDLMGLAGVHPVGPQHMPVDNPEQGPSKVVSAPPNMQDLIAMVDKPEADTDSMNDGEEQEDESSGEKEENRPYDSSPHEKIGQDGVRKFGDIDNNHQNALVGKNRGTAESIVASLFQDYQNFVTEANKK